MGLSFVKWGEGKRIEMAHRNLSSSTDRNLYGTIEHSPSRTIDLHNKTSEAWIVHISRNSAQGIVGTMLSTSPRPRIGRTQANNPVSPHESQATWLKTLGQTIEHPILHQGSLSSGRPSMKQTNVVTSKLMPAAILNKQAYSNIDRVCLHKNLMNPPRSTITKLLKLGLCLHLRATSRDPHPQGQYKR